MHTTSSFQQVIRSIRRRNPGGKYSIRTKRLCGQTSTPSTCAAHLSAGPVTGAASTEL